MIDLYSETNNDCTNQHPNFKGILLLYTCAKDYPVPG